MPEPGQSMLNRADQDDRQRDDRDVPTPSQSPTSSRFAEKNRAAHDGGQTGVFKRQINQVQPRMHNPETHDRRVQFR